jgi:hypothetical protein
MTAFNGPWSKDLDSFKKSVQSMPEQYKSSFASASKTALEKVCDPDVLHVWESNSDIDSLLQLTSVIAKLCDLGVRKNKAANKEDGCMLIIAEESTRVNNFSRICQLVEYLTGAGGKKHLDGTVAVFSKIVVVRGWDNSVTSGQKEALEKTVKRINIAIERVFKMGNVDKMVWHHGPAIHFLLQWINNTTSTLRSALSTITVTGSLDLTDGIAPSPAGRANKLPDLERLESYGKKLDIPVVFLDSASQLITFEYLGTYMYFYSYYLNTFLPSALSKPHLYKAMDELVTFAFQLRGASESRYGSDVIKIVQKKLDANKAKHWARHCVAAASYEKSKCRAAGKDEAIHHAVQLADSPFALLTPGVVGVPAFARLSVGPASTSAHEYYQAAPVSISFKEAKLRPSAPSTFHILTPTPAQDLEKVTNRVQGLMMAVLERVRQEKGNPVLGETEKGMWNAAVKACNWAIEGAEGKMPSGVKKKVEFVKQKFKEGTWGNALNAPDTSTATTGMAAGAVQPMPEPNRTYGFNPAAQNQGPGMSTYPQQQQMGGFAGGQTVPQGPMPSPVQGAAYAATVPGQMPPQGMMQAQSQGDFYRLGPVQGGGRGQSAVLPPAGGYAGGQTGGRGGGYPQSMGGPWSG